MKIGKGAHTRGDSVAGNSGPHLHCSVNDGRTCAQCTAKSCNPHAIMTHLWGKLEMMEEAKLVIHLPNTFFSKAGGVV